METARVEHSGQPLKGRKEMRQEAGARRDLSRGEASLAEVGEAGGGGL